MNYAIILAAGESQRCEGVKDKLLVEVAGQPIIYYSLMAFNDHPDIDDVILVVNKKNEEKFTKLIKEYKFKKVSKIVLGGSSRQESLGQGLNVIEKKAKPKDVIIVHNGANPLPSINEITECINISAENGACIVGHFINSTIKEISKEKILKTHNRENLFAAETPQAAQYSILKKALKNAIKEKLVTTDEAMLLEAIDQDISYIQADEHNIKITKSSDIKNLKAILGELPKDIKVGIGQDSHMFKKEEMGLFLGGLELKDEKKLKANSDGDVILHAIFNAISQAIGENSIGFYADEMCEQGIKDSKEYLKMLLSKTKKKKLKINSLGIMLECKTPKIDPLVPKLKKSLSEILNLKASRIGITATSGEYMTLFGAGLGIQCFAIVSLKKE
ncbi:MAG TPA: 2-C-methyl-D-erythritol 2,4-cyclodiphosphate synthase [Flavobacteriales bacterium]|nr:2-C-methyl-D-erythritol 2,4-cyclodiphosphate synthase [Flavobacteriales bacterium]